MITYKGFKKKKELKEKRTNRLLTSLVLDFTVRPFLVMVCWNGFMTRFFGLDSIHFGNAIVLCVLVGLLFKSTTMYLINSNIEDIIDEQFAKGEEGL